VRWINCPRNEIEENVEAMQCKGKVFFMTVKDIHPGQELMFYYGDTYAVDELDITYKL
jgi:SET domain-containing protein